MESQIITISSVQRVVYVAGAAHYLSRAGTNRVLAWLFSYAMLVRGWADVGEYVFRVEVQL